MKKPKHIQILDEAVSMAEEWRGSRNPEDWNEFDEMIVEMRAAVKSAWDDHKFRKTSSL